MSIVAKPDVKLEIPDGAVIADKVYMDFICEHEVVILMTSRSKD